MTLPTKLLPPVETPPLYGQDGQGYNAICYAHLFISNADWLLTEYDPHTDTAFGWAKIGNDWLNAELGYFKLERIASAVRGHEFLFLDIERDWTPKPLHEAIRQLRRRSGYTADTDRDLRYLPEQVSA